MIEPVEYKTGTKFGKFGLEPVEYLAVSDDESSSSSLAISNDNVAESVDEEGNGSFGDSAAEVK